MNLVRLGGVRRVVGLPARFKTKAAFVGRVPPGGRKIGAGLWALHQWGFALVRAAGWFVDVPSRRDNLDSGNGMIADEV